MMPTAVDSSWVILLAGGDGTRLCHLTTTKEGVAVPKQFCSLHGGHSLMQESLHRASTIATQRRIVAVVTERHRRWWQPQLWSLPPNNIVEQPTNRGTAFGILLPLLHILERDPTANVVLLPCDHYVDDEAVLAEAIRTALRYVRLHDDYPVLLGMEPELPDPELGYIVPGVGSSDRTASVLRFAEKPPRPQALQLIDRGALWNTFIVVSRGRALLHLFDARLADLVAETRAVVRRSLRDGDRGLVVDLYQRLPVLDFSKHILQSQEHRLRVLPVPACGWSDLGTPERVGATLSRLPGDVRREAHRSTTVHVNLARQHAIFSTHI